MSPRVTGALIGLSAAAILMLAGVLGLTGLCHGHPHVHEVPEHEHAHVHDEHHQHDHAGTAKGGSE